MWPFKKKPVDTPVAAEVKPKEQEEKELPELKWELSVGPWHKESRCEHCGHVWTDDTKSHDEDPCPTCGCIGSHRMQVIRYEHEHTQWFDTYCGTYPSAWQGVRNEKTVVWDGCSVKKDANDK